MRVPPAAPDAAPFPSAHPASHLRPGPSLLQIARANDLNVTDIVALNPEVSNSAAKQGTTRRGIKKVPVPAAPAGAAAPRASPAATGTLLLGGLPHALPSWPALHTAA